MNALIILIPVTLVLIGFATGLFFWAVRHDQFQDLDTPEILPLMDEAPMTGTRYSETKEIAP
ncbi:MAG TPA: cbb3-type cytochrome oxidase assembly protein CcoS [Oleiagrimonas sp.]|nr:cbb3-type cytochrome oxidase assembly protein CcoS [Oleiagrimonas sp.]